MDESRLCTLVRTSYDRIAEKYADTFYTELMGKPFDSALLNRFAESLGPGALIADIGCGPGQIGRYLADRGLRSIGVDLSVEMLFRAAHLNPDIPLACQDMRTLAARSGCLSGIAAFYSLIHLLDAGIDQALREFHRVLRPGGLVLIAMHGGAGFLHVESMLGEPVPMYATLVEMDALRVRVENSGFTVVEAHSRAPYDFEYQSRRHYLLGRKSC